VVSGGALVQILSHAAIKRQNGRVGQNSSRIRRQILILSHMDTCKILLYIACVLHSSIVDAKSYVMICNKVCAKAIHTD
jgi:hypothetical protein